MKVYSLLEKLAGEQQVYTCTRFPAQASSISSDKWSKLSQLASGCEWLRPSAMFPDSEGIKVFNNIDVNDVK